MTIWLVLFFVSLNASFWTNLQFKCICNSWLRAAKKSITLILKSVRNIWTCYLLLLSNVVLFHALPDMRDFFAQRCVFFRIVFVFAQAASYVTCSLKWSYPSAGCPPLGKQVGFTHMLVDAIPSIEIWRKREFLPAVERVFQPSSGA